MTFIADEHETELDAIRTRLGAIQEWSEEYNTEHVDAGNAYDVIVQEGYWPDQLKRIADHIRDNPGTFTISNSALDAIADRISSDIEVEWHPGHIFSNPSGCCIAACAIGEIEEQVELRSLADDCGIELELAAELMLHIANVERDFCLRFDEHATKQSHPCAYLYIYTDAVWYGILPDEQIADHVTEAILSYCRATDHTA